MLPNGIDYLYSAVEVAVDNCNSDSIEFDPARTKDNFAQDLMSMTSFVACADGKITAGELEIINRILDLYGYGLDEKDCQELLKTVRENEFQVPTTLKVLVLSSEKRIEGWSDIDFNMSYLVKVNEMIQLGSAIYAYANIMCYLAVEGKMNVDEKRLIDECLKKCVDYVADVFGPDFYKHCDYRSITNRVFIYNK